MKNEVKEMIVGTVEHQFSARKKKNEREKCLNQDINNHQN